MGDAELKLTFRLVVADDERADPVVLDDIVRLIQQAAATLPVHAPRLTEPKMGFQQPGENIVREIRSLESKIETRIQQSSAASQDAVESRARQAIEPNGTAILAGQARSAAERIVSIVQGAVLRRMAIRVSESKP